MDKYVKIIITLHNGAGRTKDYLLEKIEIPSGMPHSEIDPMAEPIMRMKSRIRTAIIDARLDIKAVSPL